MTGKARKKTVKMKAPPKIRPVILRNLRLKGPLEEILGTEYISSDVINTIIAVIASHRLISVSAKGKLIAISLALF